MKYCIIDEWGFAVLLVMQRTRARLIAYCVCYPTGLEKPVYIRIQQQQIEAIRCAYDGKVASIWLPTSLGKSLCHEAWLYVMDHKLGTGCSMLSIIMPLVLLMIDIENNRLQWCAVQHAWYIHCTSRFSSIFWVFLYFCTHLWWIPLIYFLG